VNEGPEKTFVLVLDEGDDPMEMLRGFADEEKITAGRFTAIGAFRNVVIGYYEMESLQYKKISFEEQLEVLSMMGDIAIKNGDPVVHAHVVLGRSDGTVRGGHLVEAYVRPTLEVMLVESPDYLQRTMDETSGLPLIAL
jgi:hypothetical protein